MFETEDSTRNLVEFEPTPFYLAACIAMAILAASAIVAISSKAASATAAYAAQTGYSCGQCHVNPSGGDLTSFGSNWAKKKNKGG